MKIRTFGIIALIIIMLGSFSVRAEVHLPAIFGDNMVLQQQTSTAIWGTASATTPVKITTSWNNGEYETLSDKDGKWKLKVETPTAGGPYEITISDGQPLTLSNVLIGEVWVCSGQSNMQMPMWGYKNQPVAGSTNDIVKSSNKNIRLFTVGHNVSFEPSDDFKGDWKETVPENTREFSATAYYFGRLLQEVLDVPVGLICSSWGGTRIEPWISETGLKNFDFVDYRERPNQHRQQTPSVLFNAMINPMIDYSVQGAIWYQGEANKNEPDQYVQLLPALIQDWRKQWGKGDLSFYYVQIAPFKYIWGGPISAYFREAQLKVSQMNIPKTGIACLMDTGEEFNIHPANKKAVGERLAYQALVKTYGFKGFEYEGPVLKEMTTDGQMVHLTFDHAQNGLTTFGQPLEHFEVAGENQRFFKAEAAITKAGVSLFCAEVEEPVAVRYAFKDFVVGELFNVEGLPVSSFRTDTW